MYASRNYSKSSMYMKVLCYLKSIYHILKERTKCDNDLAYLAPKNQSFVGFLSNQLTCNTVSKCKSEASIIFEINLKKKKKTICKFLHNYGKMDCKILLKSNIVVINIIPMVFLCTHNFYPKSAR